MKKTRTIKPFHALNPFISNRIRSGVGRIFQNLFGISDAEAPPPEIQAEIELAHLHRNGPYAHLPRDSSPQEEHVAMIFHRAETQARLDALGDLSHGCTAEEGETLFAKHGFEPVLDIDSRYRYATPEKPMRERLWAHPEHGIILQARYDQTGNRYDWPTSTVYLQWTPNLPMMGEDNTDNIPNEGTVIDRATACLGGAFGGGYSGGFYNPARPALGHGQLHYPRSYPELTEDERTKWQNDYKAAPAWVNKERGQWIYALSHPMDRGIVTPAFAMVKRGGGHLVTPWRSGYESHNMVRQVLLDDILGSSMEKKDEIALMQDRAAQTPDWFQTMIEQALVPPEKAQAHIDHRKNMRSILHAVPK